MKGKEEKVLTGLLQRDIIKEKRRSERAMLVKKPNNIAELVKVLTGEMKMTHQEIADYIGCDKYLVSRWKIGMNYAKDEYYGKVQDMVMRLSGRGIRYPRQAADVLREEDELEKAGEYGEEC